MVLSSLNIGNKLALIMIALSIVVIAALSALFYFQFDAALRERVLLQLSSVKQLKIVKIKNELADLVNAFEALDQNRERLANDPFGLVQTYNEIPDSVGGFAIGQRMKSQNPNRLRLVDLTLEAKDQRITVALIKPVDDSYRVAIAEVPEIQNILLQRTGLGQTGESYIVGGDFKMRSKSRFFKGNPGKIRVETVGVKRSLDDNPGEDLFLDYRKVEVFSSYEKIDLYGLTWVVLSEIDHQEAFFPLRELRKNLVIFLVIILAFVLVVSYLLSQMVVRPVVSMEKKLMIMSQGILEGISTTEHREDEIGRMFEALNRLVVALNDTIVFADKIGSGNFDAEYHKLSDDDKLGEALIRMQNKLKEYQLKEAQLIKENQRSILNGEEKERSRLSKEMHDGLGPLLTTLRMSLQSAGLEAKTKTKLLERLDDTITEVRRISNNLMPSVLVDFGAGEAIGNLVAYMREHSGIKILFKNDMTSESDIAADIQIALYRIAQESINNAIKHAMASEIKVSITEFEDHIDYFISDNGQGFDTSDYTSGNGLRNMKERVKLANGHMEIHSDSSGTTIEVEIPIA